MHDDPDAPGYVPPCGLGLQTLRWCAG